MPWLDGLFWATSLLSLRLSAPTVPKVAWIQPETGLSRNPPCWDKQGVSRTSPSPIPHRTGKGQWAAQPPGWTHGLPTQGAPARCMRDSSKQTAWSSNLYNLTSACRSYLCNPYNQLPLLLPLHAKHCYYVPGNLCLHCNISGTGRLSLLCFGRHPTCFQAFNKQSRNDSDGEAET